jgi:hypothetical protein
MKLPNELKLGAADDDDIFGPSNAESNDFYSAVSCDNVKKINKIKIIQPNV